MIFLLKTTDIFKFKNALGCFWKYIPHAGMPIRLSKRIFLCKERLIVLLLINVIVYFNDFKLIPFKNKIDRIQRLFG
jgi:hypothetical protein